MSLSFRNYGAEPGFSDDFHKVRNFLVRINQKNPIQYHFEWGRWEWAFSLPFLDTTNLSKIGLWQDNGKIVALATFETSPGSVYFCLDQDYLFLKSEMLSYAQQNLCSPQGKLQILINNADREFQKLAAGFGYKPTQDNEASSVMDIDVEKIHYTLPGGFTIRSLADEADLFKLNRVLWRGFNHPGDPPETPADIEERRVSISGPNLKHELCIYALSAEEDYACYCGMWYDPHTQYALVEPLATDPKYRKLGLGKAVVLDAVKRCAQIGARQAYVGSSQQFYYQIGFHPLPGSTFWEIL